MQERARSEVIGILGDKPIIPTSEQLKVAFANQNLFHILQIFLTLKNIF